MVAAAVLVSPDSQATVTFKSSSITLGVQSGMPSGAVGGVQSPAEVGSTLNLLIDASEAGAELSSVQASIGANHVWASLCLAPAPLAGELGSECPESVSDIPLSIGVGGEGERELLVTVTDTAGKTATLIDQTVDVVGPPLPGSNAITLGVNGGFPGPPGPPHEPPGHEPPGHEPPGGEEGPSGKSPSCPSPMLEMHLTSKPLGYTRLHVPVLLAGRRALFRGRLTCLYGHHRVAAPNGTPVQVLYEHAGCALGLPICTSKSREPTTFVHKGHLKVRLLIVGPGTVIFRYRPVHGESVQVSLPVAVGRRHHRGDHPRDRRHHARTHGHRSAREHGHRSARTHGHRSARTHGHRSAREHGHRSGRRR